MSNARFVPTSGAFIAASWTSLFTGILGFLIAVWNASLLPSEKGFYLAVMMLGLYAAVSLQKAVRDRLEGVPVTSIYYGISWLAMVASLLLMLIGLWNSTLALSERGFYGMAFLMSLFAAVAVQKNVRDRAVQSNGGYELE